MNAKKLTGIALATAAAGLFSMSSIAASHTGAAPAEGKIQCDGVNGCKGTSDCKTDKNACKGQNACKGTGFKELSKADCDKAKAEAKK
jgi:hypothetical protein